MGDLTETLLRLAIPLPLTILVVVFALRIVLRHVARNVRGSRLGELMWYEVVRESRGSSGSNLSIEGQVAAVKAMITAIQYGNWPYTGRGVISIIWQKDIDRDSGLLRMYVGIDRSHVDEGATIVRSVASGLNGRAEEMSRPPNIPTRGLIVAHRGNNAPNEVAEIPQVTGTVARSLSEARDLYGTLIFTLDPMRESEAARFEANFSEGSIMRAGASTLYSSDIGNRARTVSGSAVRTSIGAVSGDGNPRNSNSLLNLALGHITTLGVKYDTREPIGHFHRLANTALLSYIGLMGLLTFIKILTIPVAVALVAVPIVLLVMSIMRMPILASSWFADRLSKGEIVVPSFVWWNLRWWIHANIRSRRHDAGGETRVSNKIAPPSCKQVVTLYAAPLTEIMTVSADQKAGIVDVAQERVPLIGFPSNFEAREPDDIFVGYTGTDQVATIPINDTNHGIFVAGAPESGKTNVLHVIYSGVARASRINHGDLRITPIWAECSKGVGAYDAYSLVEDDPRAILIDAHNPLSGYRLALEGLRLVDGASPDDVLINCSMLVGGLQFAWGDSIMDSSKEALEYSMQVAMLLLPDEIRALGLDAQVDPERPNVLRLAWLVLGGDVMIQPGPALKKMHSDIVASASRDKRETYLANAISVLNMYLDPNNREAASRRAAPLNKLSSLMKARAFWEPSPDRVDVQIDQLVSHFAPVVLNLGPYWVPDQRRYSSPLNSIDSRYLLLVTNFIIWNYVKDNCSGWGDTGRRIPVFIDEVRDVAVDSDGAYNVLASVSAEGRSRGMSYICAAQNLAQLPLQARHEVMSFRTKVWCELPNSDDAARVMEDIGRGSVYTSENIKQIPLGMAVASLKKHHDRTPWFTLKVPYAKEWGRYLKQSRTIDEAIDAYGEGVVFNPDLSRTR